MYVLEDLWTGKVAFRDETVQDGSLYQEISRKSISYLEKFRKELSPEGKKSAGCVLQRTNAVGGYLGEGGLHPGSTPGSPVHS